MSDQRRPWYDDSEYVGFCHASDMDGLACALLLDQFTQVGDVRFLDYPLPEDLGAEGKVVICDLNLEPDHPAWRNPQAVVFDHHGAAPADAAVRVADAHEDGDACAALLLCRALPPVPYLWTWGRFIETVNAADLYREDDPRFAVGRRYQWLVNKLGIETLFRVARAKPLGFISLPAWVHELVRAAMERENRQALSAALMLARRIPGTPTGLPDFMLSIIATGDRSTVLNEMARQYGGPAAAIDLATIDEQVRVQVSIRDPAGRAREIAQAFGGGGHAEAAGWTMDLMAATLMWERQEAGPYRTVPGQDPDATVTIHS